MKVPTFAVALVLFLVACTQEQPVTATTPLEMREALRVEYVGAPELPVREKPDESSAVVATYQNGEAVSILAEQGDWVEIRTGAGTGWAKKSDLATATEQQAHEEDPQPKFRVMPLPVSAPGAKGEIYLEADVNSDGEVMDVRTISNTTGLPLLAKQNSDALRTAKFYPIVIRGEAKPFKYYHRVTY